MRIRKPQGKIVWMPIVLAVAGQVIKTLTEEQSKPKK